MNSLVLMNSATPQLEVLLAERGVRRLEVVALEQ
jgi:hypothetical protein